jgi:hypothetical protein
VFRVTRNLARPGAREKGGAHVYRTRSRIGINRRPVFAPGLAPERSHERVLDRMAAVPQVSLGARVLGKEGVDAPPAARRAAVSACARSSIRFRVSPGSSRRSYSASGIWGPPDRLKRRKYNQSRVRRTRVSSCAAKTATSSISTPRSAPANERMASCGSACIPASSRSVAKRSSFDTLRADTGTCRARGIRTVIGIGCAARRMLDGYVAAPCPLNPCWPGDRPWSAVETMIASGAGQAVSPTWSVPKSPVPCACNRYGGVVSPLSACRSCGH